MSFLRSFALFSALLAAGSKAGPVAIRSADFEMLQDRDLSITLGQYDLTTKHENDVILNIAPTVSQGILGETFHLEVECIDCRTWGTAVVTTSGVTKDEDIIGDIISFFKDPLDTVMNAFDLDVKVSFEDVGGHFEFGILASDTLSYSIPIYKSDWIAGIAVSEEATVGLLLIVDLVFSLTAEIELEAGFEFAFPDGAYITIDPLTGDIVDQGFTGGDVKNLPVTVTSGSATVKAALRVRVQAGTTIECFGTGFDFELGVYADLIEYVATLSPTSHCDLELKESLDVNFGAFAHAVTEIDYKKFGSTPAVVTTVLELPLPSLCLTLPTGAASLSLPSGTEVPALSITASNIPAQSYAASSVPASGSASLSLVAPTGSASIPFFSPTITSVPYPEASAYDGSSFAESSYEGFSYAASSYAESSYAASSYGAASSASVSRPSNRTVTASAGLTTSTVVSTSLITITSCSSTVLNCPASLASEIVITSTAVLYTTVCPVGASLPTTLPSSLSVASLASATVVIQTITAIVSPLKLTPCATPGVQTIYTPTFTDPAYTMPTATSFTVPHPNFTVPYSAPSLASTVQPIRTIVAALSSATVYPVPVSTSKANGTIASTGAGTGKGTIPKPTYAVAYTGGASRLGGEIAALIIAVGMGVILL